MAHRKRRKETQRHERERQQRSLAGRIRKHPKTVAVGVSLVAFVVVLAALAATTPREPMQCFSVGERTRLAFDAKLFIWVGTARDLTAEFIRIDTNIGVDSGCRWPLTTGPDTVSERSFDWVAVHVRSPVVASYTLGDFFYVWGQTIGQEVYFGPDGVSVERGPTTVSYNGGPYVIADPSMVFRPNDLIEIQVIPGA